MNRDITDLDRGYSVTIPDTTIAGEAVSVRSGERDRIHILHAESPDQCEVYFEITTHPGLREHTQLAADQRAFLVKNAPDGGVAEPTRTHALGRTAMSFDFRGTLQGRFKVRRFLFVDDTRTYRVVYDPTSVRNEQILRTLRLGIRP